MQDSVFDPGYWYITTQEAQWGGWALARTGDLVDATFDIYGRLGFFARSRAAIQALLPDPFFCLNSDNIWLDGPKNAFHDLSRRWDPETMDALLLVVPHARACNFSGPGDFHMDPLGRLSRRRDGRIAPFIYTGIQLVSHRLLRDAPDGPFSTNILWNRAMAEGRLYGISFTGLWFEVGTPQMIRPTEEALLGG